MDIIIEQPSLDYQSKIKNYFNLPEVISKRFRVFFFNNKIYIVPKKLIQHSINEYFIHMLSSMFGDVIITFDLPQHDTTFIGIVHQNEKLSEIDFLKKATMYTFNNNVYKDTSGNIMDLTEKHVSILLTFFKIADDTVVLPNHDLVYCSGDIIQTPSIKKYFMENTWENATCIIDNTVFINQQENKLRMFKNKVDIKDLKITSTVDWTFDGYSFFIQKGNGLFKVDWNIHVFFNTFNSEKFNCSWIVQAI